MNKSILTGLVLAIFAAAAVASPISGDSHKHAKVVVKTSKKKVAVKRAATAKKRTGCCGKPCCKPGAPCCP